MTLMPAQRLQNRAPMFQNKGRISEGADADITVFDPQRIIDKATFDDPPIFQRYPVRPGEWRSRRLKR